MSQSNSLKYINCINLVIRENRLARNIKTIDAASNIGLKFRYYSYIERNPKKGTALYMYSLMTNGLRIMLSDVLNKAHNIIELEENKVVYSSDFVEIDSSNLIIQLCYEIKKERKQINFTQKDLGKKTNIHRRYIGDIENGKSGRLSVTTFLNISDALEVPLHVLVYRAEQALLNEANKNEN